MKIKKCVITIAGFGTRLLPITKTISKEMIPIIDLPVIFYQVKEAYLSGIEEIIFVVSKRNIDLIKNFFSIDNVMIKEIKDDPKKANLLDEVNEIINNMKFTYVIQKIRGTYGSLYSAKDLLGNEPFALMYGDDLVVDNPPLLKQMISIYEKTKQSVVAVRYVEEDKLPKFGIIEYKNGNKHFKLYIYNTVRLKEEGASYISDSSISIEESRSIMLENNVSTLKDTIINVIPSLYIVNNGQIYDYIAGGVEPAKYLIDTKLDSRSYSDIESATLSNIDDFYLLDYKKYYIYLYFDRCPHCFSIKPNVLNYLTSYKNKETPIFVFNIYESSSEKGQEIRNKFKRVNDVESVNDFKNRYVKENIDNKTDKLEDTYFNYVPSLYEISENHYSNCYIGENEIIDLLNS